jgi:hypothetical protein
MGQTRFRQVAHLERLAKPFLERRQEYDTQTYTYLREKAFRIAANLSLLILYGKPKSHESLRSAWERCRESAAWRSCREQNGGFDENGDERGGTPFDMLGAMQIAKYFRKHFLPALPGADEKEKLNAIFKTAPRWLLWFNHGDFCARLLGLKLPDFSKLSRFKREPPRFDFLRAGPFEWHLLPDGEYDPLVVLRREKFEDESMEMTPRERKRMLKIKERQMSRNSAT